MSQATFHHRPILSATAKLLAAAVLLFADTRASRAQSDTALAADPASNDANADVAEAERSEDAAEAGVRSLEAALQNAKAAARAARSRAARQVIAVAAPQPSAPGPELISPSVATLLPEPPSQREATPAVLPAPPKAPSGDRPEGKPEDRAVSIPPESRLAKKQENHPSAVDPTSSEPARPGFVSESAHAAPVIAVSAGPVAAAETAAQPTAVKQETAGIRTEVAAATSSLLPTLPPPARQSAATAPGVAATRSPDAASLAVGEPALKQSDESAAALAAVQHTDADPATSAHPLASAAATPAAENPSRTAATRGSRLASYSPFLGDHAAAKTGAKPEGASFELRGIMSLDGDTKYCIYDSKRKTSVWIGLKESGFPFEVVTADPYRDQVNLSTSDGRMLSLALKEAKISGVKFEGQDGAPVAREFASAASVSLDGVPPKNPQDEQGRLLEERRQEFLKQRRARLDAMKAANPSAPIPQS